MSSCSRRPRIAFLGASRRRWAAEPPNQPHMLTVQLLNKGLEDRQGFPQLRADTESKGFGVKLNRLLDEVALDQFVACHGRTLF